MRNAKWANKKKGEGNACVPRGGVSHDADFGIRSAFLLPEGQPHHSPGRMPGMRDACAPPLSCAQSERDGTTGLHSRATGSVLADDLCPRVALGLCAASLTLGYDVRPLQGRSSLCSSGCQQVIARFDVLSRIKNIKSTCSWTIPTDFLGKPRNSFWCSTPTDSTHLFLLTKFPET
jgi:hypothetical protein